MNLALNSKTKVFINSLIANHTHAVLVIAPEGSGKLSLLQLSAKKLLGLSTQKKLDTYPYYFHYSPIKGVITIDQVREIITKSKLKTIGENSIRRVILIEDAHLMGIEAQNAILKLLEEPPADTIILMSASELNQILPTVASRCTVFKMPLPTKDDLIKCFTKSDLTSEEFDKYYLLSRGRPGLLSALINNEDHSLAISINHIKNLLKMNTYERLIYIEKTEFKNSDLTSLLDGVMSICSVAIKNSIEKNNEKDVLKWLAVYKTASETYDIKSFHPNSNLLFSNLVLSM